MARGSFSLDGQKPKRRGGFSLEDHVPTKKAKSLAHEDKIAKDGGGWRVPASGAIGGMPGDVTGISRFLIDGKGSDTSGMHLTQKDIEKVEAEAASQGLVPAIGLQLRGKRLGRKEWMVIPQDVFFAMLDVCGWEYEKWA